MAEDNPYANKFYPKWMKYRPNGTLNPDYIVPVADWEKWETPPTDKDATRYIVPKANNSSATEFSKYRQWQDEYIVPAPRDNDMILAPDRGTEYILLADDLKDLKDFNAKRKQWEKE